MTAVSRFISDAQLLAESRVEMIRMSGPGGQKRNKTASGIRLTHQPTGMSVIAGESRKSSENKTRALRRLRLKLAVSIREPLALSQFEPPDWLLVLRRDRQLWVSHRHAHYAAVCGLLLDLMSAADANPATVATMLGVSTTAIIKLLEAEPTLWTEANHLRRQAGQSPLTHRR